MADRRTVTEAPYVAQDPQEVAGLVRRLEDEAKKGKSKQGITVRKTKFDVARSRDGYQVAAWKLNDWDYKQPNLPTYARGLFTTRSQNGVAEIAVRGYDKFFNVNEVPQTTWDDIEARTRGPYELTLKENGCIIFVAGLADDTLLVCSKHSTGDRAQVAAASASHSSVGEARLAQQLERLGRTKADLARELRRRNVTAVAELCDDEFEEHILAYGPERAGLYLHGLNLNVPGFATYPSVLVQDFAQAWGFQPVGLLTLANVAEVRSFLEGVAETGAYDGRDVEGFVVRCKRLAGVDGVDGGDGRYEDWFFKYKFEEPYLMYRQWRECTKKMINGHTPHFKKHVAITTEYLHYVRQRLQRNPRLGAQYNRNHGIIQLRNDFLAFKNMNGADAANWEALHADDGNGSAGGLADVVKDVILVPVATLGCGKTTIGVALGRLLGFGLVQNDNIGGARRPPRFTQQVLEQLRTHTAVVADRNNAQRRERQQILHDVRMQHVGARLVALNFVHDDRHAVAAATKKRVQARGDRHQTIRAGADWAKASAIMDGFLNRFEPLDRVAEPDSGFDAVIDLDPLQDSRVNLETVVRALHRMCPKLVPDMPSAQAMDEAMQAALDDYDPESMVGQGGAYDGSAPRSKQQQQVKNDKGQAQPGRVAASKPRPLEYVGVVVPTADVLQVLEQVFQGRTPEEARFFRQLQQTRRVQSSFHVTLMHRATAREHPQLWQQYVQRNAEAQARFEAAPEAAEAGKELELGRLGVLLERVVFDGRIMALVVRLVDGGDGSAAAAVGEEAQAETTAGQSTNKWTCVNKVSHITVGTRDNQVKPKESNDLLQRWQAEGSTAANRIVDFVVEGRPTLAGVVRPVLSR